MLWRVFCGSASGVASAPRVLPALTQPGLAARGKVGGLMSTAYFNPLLILFCFISVLMPQKGNDKSDPPRALRVGIIASLYRDHPEEEVKTAVESFKELILAHTGFQGDPVKVESVDRLGDDLVKDRMQLGVFFGHEFAWVREKHPELKPLAIVVNQIPYQRAYLLVRKDDKLSAYSDLKGKSLAIARHTPEPC